MFSMCSVCFTEVHQAFIDSNPPAIVQDCLKHLQLPASLATEGVFRRVPKMSHMNLLKQVYDLGIPVDLTEWPDSAILASSLLKLYLRSLPAPLISTTMYSEIRSCPVEKDKAIEHCRTELLPSLSTCTNTGGLALLLLQQIMHTLSMISQHSSMSHKD